MDWKRMSPCYEVRGRCQVLFRPVRVHLKQAGPMEPYRFSFFTCQASSHPMCPG
jgi:hypothetical protein